MTCLFHYSSLCGIRNNVKRDPLRYVKSNGEDTNESKEEGGEKEKIEGGVGEEKNMIFTKGNFTTHMCRTRCVPRSPLSMIRYERGARKKREAG